MEAHAGGGTGLGAEGANKTERSRSICQNHIFLLFSQVHQFRGKEQGRGAGGGLVEISRDELLELASSTLESESPGTESSPYPGLFQILLSNAYHLVHHAPLFLSTRGIVLPQPQQCSVSHTHLSVLPPISPFL